MICENRMKNEASTSKDIRMTNYNTCIHINKAIV